MQIEKLTESEEIVMKAIWDCKKDVVVADVIKRVNDDYKKDWKPQTVSTFLAKLTRKQYLKMHHIGNIYTYKVLVREEVYNREQLKKLYIYLYKGDKETLQGELEKL